MLEGRRIQDLKDTNNKLQLQVNSQISLSSIEVTSERRSSSIRGGKRRQSCLLPPVDDCEVEVTSLTQGLKLNAIEECDDDLDDLIDPIY
jgi:hypothetical protein